MNQLGLVFVVAKDNKQWSLQFTVKADARECTIAVSDSDLGGDVFTKHLPLKLDFWSRLLGRGPTLHLCHTCQPARTGYELKLIISVAGSTRWNSGKHEDLPAWSEVRQGPVILEMANPDDHWTLIFKPPWEPEPERIALRFDRIIRIGTIDMR